ncbi:hypothetical protein OAK62_01740 [Deltaproteobacteria bacterium]|nr:hypothetical protein [Deltaproteobacteria bacterium]
MKLLLKLSLITASMLIFTFTGWCNDDSVIYLALQNGNQDTGSPAPLVGRKDTYLSALEEIHGDLKENRDVSPIILSFDFYKTNGSFASGFGLEVHSYNKSYSFENDSSSVRLSAVGLLYGLNFYYRGDFWFPFIGFGTGNYSVKVKEELNLEGSKTFGTVFGQVDKPFFYKLGIRIPLNGIGIVLTQQYTSADIMVATENKPLSLGGTASFFGLYYTF